MGRGATKAQGNVWYEARINAASWNDKLQSRFGAAEEMKISEDAVKSAELDLYKSMPVENAVLMADCYRAPHLLNYYCLKECPIGRNKPLSSEVVGLDRVTVKLLHSLKPDDVTAIRNKLLDIAEDGVISEDELPTLQEIMKYLDELSKTVSELRIIGETAMKKVGV